MNRLQLISKYCLMALLSLSLFALNPTAWAQDDDDDFFVFDEDEEDVQEIADPLEGFNRAMFSINDKLYRGVLKPVARGLRILPEPVRNSGANFFNNLGTPISALNALLQFDLPNAGTELSRFVINTTIGLLGLFDPATDLGIAEDNEDLGQTLAHYGVGHGFYVVVPFLGPSSMRDGFGMLGDAFVNPVYDNLSTVEVVGANVLEAEIDLSLDQDTYEAFYESALDPYIFFRSAYVQNRAGRVEE